MSYGSTGGGAASSATGYNVRSLAVAVSATAIGGDGQWSVGGAGSGGVASASAAGGSTSGPVSVTVTQIGGNGIGPGGTGASSSLLNAASGSTSGTLSLVQIAVGGNSDTSTSGQAGGSASSVLSMARTCSSLSGLALATGGSGLLGGNATANVGLAGTSLVMATAEANAGSGQNLPGGSTPLSGAAVAHAAASGNSGYANAQATTSGGLFDSISVTATEPLVVSGTAESRRRSLRPARPVDCRWPIGRIVRRGAAFGCRRACRRGWKSRRSVEIHPKRQQFGSRPRGSRRHVSAGVSGASTSFSATANVAINPALLSSPHNLELGLVNPTFNGSQVDQLQFVVQTQNTVVVNQTFATPSAAKAFFQDQVLDLGSLSPSGSHLNLSIATVTTHRTGAGFNMGLLIGNIATANLNWSGPSNVWDAQNTQDWTNGGSPAAFFAGDSVSVGDAGPATIDIEGIVQPSAVSISSSRAVTLGGNGSISGPGGLTKSGTGTLAVMNDNAYTGPTTIGQGELVVKGSLVSPVTVQSGGTLGGTGNLSSGTVNAGGHLAPGNLNTGALIIAGNLDFESGELDIVGAGSSATSVSIMDSLSLNGGPTLDVTGNLAAGQYTIATYGGTLSGRFGTLNIPAGDTINYGTGSNSSITLSAVPEPSTIALLCVAAIGLLGYAWRRRRS